jgi:hypothetical protein
METSLSLKVLRQNLFKLSTVKFNNYQWTVKFELINTIEAEDIEPDKVRELRDIEKRERELRDIEELERAIWGSDELEGE